MSAFSRALAFESASDTPVIRDMNRNPVMTEKGDLIYQMTGEELYRYAKIIAYKVAGNLENGYKLDENDSPLN